MEKGPTGLSYHKEIISKFCRVCGSYIQLKTGYVKAKSESEYSNVLFSVYQIDTQVTRYTQSFYVHHLNVKLID